MRRLSPLSSCLVLATCVACGGTDVIGSLAPAPLGVGAVADVPRSSVETAAAGGATSARTESGAQAVQDADAALPQSDDAGASDLPPGDALCVGATDQSSVCTGARNLAFQHAICSCTDVVGTGNFSTETLGNARSLANVGINQTLTLRIGRRALMDALDGHVDGSLLLGGTGTTPVAGTAEIHGALQSAGKVSFAGSIHVLGDAYSRDLPVGSGSLVIDGDLHHGSQVAAGSPLPLNVTVGGELRADDYAAPVPCACGAGQLPQLARLIAAASRNNDNAVLGLQPDALTSLTVDSTREFSCGRYYFNNVSSLSALHWNISGHVAIFVAGAFAVRGDVALTLAPGAELEIVVGGDLTLGGAARFGDPARPGASRIYVQGQVELSNMGDLPTLARPSSAFGDALFVGNLYAPAATLLVAPHSDVYGSLFVGHLMVLQSLLVHYDPSATAVPATCTGERT